MSKFSEIEMNQELEEQQRIAVELKDQLQSLETERHTLTEKINVVEAKLEVHDLQSKVQVKRAVIDQLKGKLSELEEKLKGKEIFQESTIIEEQPQVTPEQETVNAPRKYF